jgi:malonyl-CoA O-methyltransferase
MGGQYTGGMTASAPRIERSFDPIALAQVLSRLARRPEPAWLHAEVARRMSQRLEIIRMQPERLIEWWPGLGGSGSILAEAYPRAERRWVEPTQAWQERTRGLQPAWWRRTPWSRSAPDVLLEQNLSDTPEVPLIWANMMLHAAVDPLAVLTRWHQLLSVDGFVMFSCLGPDSLRELRALYAREGWPSPHVDFVDMHDLGDMLVQAGFADPVMDQEQLTLTWPDAPALLAELRQIGGNLSAERFSGLRTPRWYRQLCEGLSETANTNDRIPLTFEIVYGHAFKAPPRVPVRSETTVSLQDMKGMVRRARTTGGR